MRVLPLILVAACAAPAPTPTTPRPPLTPASVGLPARPTPDGPVAAHDAPLPSFYPREVCPPAPDGCVLARDVTIDRAFMTMTCPGRPKFSTIQPLRELHAEVAVEGPNAPYVRRALGLAERSARACFDADNVAARIDVSFEIVDGHANSFDPPLSSCLARTLASVDVPRDPPAIAVRWTLDYTVQHPSTVPPLVCPR